MHVSISATNAFRAKRVCALYANTMVSIRSTVLRTSSITVVYPRPRSTVSSISSRISRFLKLIRTAYWFAMQPAILSRTIMTTSKSVVIIDYGLGNVASASKAFAKLGASVKISRDKNDINTATHLVLPGVGAFGEGIRLLEESGVIPMITERALRQKIPFLGICLGMGLLTGIFILFTASCLTAPIPVRL